MDSGCEALRQAHLTVDPTEAGGHQRRMTRLPPRNPHGGSARQREESTGVLA
jgi:hypothetical protein